MRGADAAAGAIFAGGAAAGVCADCEAGVFAAAQDDAEVAEAGVAGGGADGGVCGAGDFDDGTGGEIGVGAFCEVDEDIVSVSGEEKTSKFKLQTSKNIQASNFNWEREAFEPRNTRNTRMQKHPSTNEIPSSNNQGAWLTTDGKRF